MQKEVKCECDEELGYWSAPRVFVALGVVAFIFLGILVFAAQNGLHLQ